MASRLVARALAVLFLLVGFCLARPLATLADADVIVLHKGHVLARGPVARVVSDAGTTDIRSAFARLTKISTADEPDEAA